MTLTLFNSYTRALEPFAPLDPTNVRVYSCGPTVYARQHLGNMRAYLFTDTLTRALRWSGYPVTHVINITDVGHLTSDADVGDDKMETAAAREQLTARQVADRYTDLFKADLAKLNVRAPTHWTVATDYIDQMIAFAERIGASTYELPTGLYFDTSTVPDYGRLAGHRADEGAEIARIEAVDGKRHAADFAIWRRSEEPGKRQMEWPSPWGIGAPGWHLECSVMSHDKLGPRFDIHTGGIDHREIHHPNEIAQNQAHSGTADTGAQVWMHNNFLVERGAKMSKSSGGFATLDTLIDAGVHPLAYRMLCLSAHYRSELEFSPDNVLAALTRLKRLVAAVSRFKIMVRESHSASSPQRRLLKELVRLSKRSGNKETWRSRRIIEASLESSSKSWLSRFEAAISSDLGTPKALAILDEVLSDRLILYIDKLSLIASFDIVFGLGLLSLERRHLRLRPAGADYDERWVEQRLRWRDLAKASRDFAMADQLRRDLIAAGVEVMDGDPLPWDWKVTL